MSTKTASHLWQRLFIEDDLAASQTLNPGAEQAHYLRNVIRLNPGEPLRLFNGRDGEWRAEMTGGKNKKDVELRVYEQLRPQTPQPELRLCPAPIKRAHFDYMIEKATELGVSNIQPVLTSRTQVRDVNVKRCHAIAVEAAEQSERLSVPCISEATALQKLASQWPAGCLPIICAEWGEAIPVHEAFSQIKDTAKAAIVTGPEGGFTAEELETLRQLPHAVFIRLGPRILRADTAAIAALSCWQAICGDWK